MNTQNTNEKSEVALREEEILAFWKEHNIFEKTVETPAGKKPEGDFVFYDGPPFATGTPHYGHILAGTIKDAIPRFWTMNGKRVERTWGWDCHGLPLENIIEKRLGLATKRDIEEMGIKQFNEAAREAVMEYADDWKRVVPRMGRFVDMETDYRTMDADYTESVWWVFSELNKKGLVYEGFKSMHLCPRCGTTLSNFEVNQGYKDIKDIAVTVKLPLLDENGSETDTSLLVWTTTPWTLPGNMAAAVHKKLMYVKVSVTRDEQTELVILAKERLDQLGTDEYEVLEEMKGKDLVGLSYKPPFDSFKDQEFPNKEHAWKIWHAEYVEIGEEGTGAVHIAPAYGEEDMELAKENDIPIIHHVDEDGRFKEFVDHLGGQLVKPKDDDKAEVSHLDSDIEIVKRLRDEGVLMRKENVTHSYPHCWRCDTPLLNYGTTSWFVKVTDIKDDLVKLNNKVKWVPTHVGENRFGKWLEGARDWAVSRQRYWGAPLPIWRREDSNEYKIFGSKEDLLQYVPRSGNTYYSMRHGISTKNVEPKVVTDEYDAPHPLTDKGKEDVKETASQLRGKIDLIITSPVLRARETADIVAKELGLSEEQVVVDELIKETDHGVYEGRLLVDYVNDFPIGIFKFEDCPEGGETWADLKRRMGEFIYSLEEEYKDKNILIVSHGDPLAMLHSVIKGLNREETLAGYNDNYPEKGIAEKIPFIPIPHNDEYEFDFHRPYIDEIELFDDDGTKLIRVPDVFDCWFESGSMPYAQHHYPFENKKEFEKQEFPAQFIAEGLDQTRGWFYSLHVLGTALFKKSPFENVVVNGLVLAEDGKKMSKSQQNYPDPMELADRVGVDAMRYYLLSSPIVKAEDLSFSEKDVLEVQRKNIGRLHNVLAMYEMFMDPSVESSPDSDHVLDQWMISRLNETTELITAGYKNYELDKATRPIADLIDDLSVWYLRRSRDRLKGGDAEDKKACLATLRYTLEITAQLLAPVMPFYAEFLFQRVKMGSGAESVHLTSWPKGGEIDHDLITAMAFVRSYANIGLKLRTQKGLKVKQPLSEFVIKHNEKAPKYWDQVAGILKAELNVKQVTLSPDSTQDDVSCDYDWNITPELKQEGEVRELIRAIQDGRKEKELSPHDKITLHINNATQKLIEGFEEMVQGIVGAGDVVISEENEHVLELEGVTYGFSIKV